MTQAAKPSNAPPTDPNQPAQSRMFRRWAIGLAAFALVVVVIGYRSALSPERIGLATESALEQMIGGEVRVDRAKLNPLTGELVITGFRWSALGMPAGASELASAERIRLRLDRGALLSLRVQPILVELDHPVVSMTEVAETGQLNWAAHRWPAAEDQPNAAPLDVPEVRITGGRYRSGTFDGGRLTAEHSVNFAGGIHVDPNDPTKLGVDLYEASEHQPTERGVRITASIDPASHAVDGKIEGLRFIDRYRDMLPTSARDLWRDLEPRGELPVITFANDPEQGPYAELSVAGVSFNLPRLTDNERRVRMEQMTGRFRFTKRGIDIIDEVTGVVEGGAHRLAGSFGGFSLGSPFRLALKTAEFDLPEKPTFIYALPEKVQKAFGMIAPSGRLRVSMALFRNEPGGRMTYEGTATLLGGKGRLDRFPYPLTGCRGIIKFNDDEVRVLNLTGDASGSGSVTITGRIWPPGEFPAIDVVVTAVDLPFDDVLFDAMNDQQRRGVKLLFDAEQYERLKEAGHFVAVDLYNQSELAASQLRRKLGSLKDGDPQRAAVERALEAVNRQLETPAFEMGGRGDVVVRVRRDPGPDAESTAAIDLAVHEASCVFTHFPYPFNATGGRITVTPRTTETVDGQRVETPPRITFDGIEMRGLHGGIARLRGTIDVDGTVDPHAVEPDVRVTAVGLPVDDLLYDCLPGGRHEVLRKLKLAGEIDINGRVFRRDGGAIDANLIVELADGTAAPGDGSLAVTGVNARLRTTLEHAELIEMTARHPAGTIEAKGAFDFTDPDHDRTDLVSRITGLNFEKVPFGAASELIDVNESWQAFLDRHEARGAFDATLRLRHDKDGRAERFVAIQPHSVGFVYDDRPVVLRKMTGEMVVDEQGVELKNLSGAIDGGRITANGTIGFDEPRRSDLRLAALGKRVTDELKNALPRVLGDLLTRLKIDGQYEIAIDRLVVRPDATGDDTHTELHGVVKLNEGKCSLGVDMADIRGSLDITAAKPAGSDWPVLNVKLAGDSLSVNGRRITELKGLLKSAKDPSALLIPELRGRMYGGAVGGSGVLDLDTQRYQMRLMMSGVELASFAAATAEKPRPESDIARPRPDAQDSKKARPLSGKLSAAIDLEGDWGKPNATRGRGGIQVTRGVMYDLPLSVGTLQLVNLALPVNRAFDRAEIAYLIKDRTMVFERIGLHSSVKAGEEEYLTNLSLRGKGTLDLDTRALDITLTSTNPAGIDLGPLSDLIDGFKDQLITIRVGGTVDNPETRVEQLSALTEAWKDVFGEGDPN